MGLALENADIRVLKKELHDIIDSADEQAIRSIYVKLKLEESEPYEWWNDEDLIEELDKRSNDLKTGKDKGVLWEDAKKDILDRRKKNE